MQCGMIGLGRMGANMARRLVRGGHEVVVSNRSPGPIEELKAEERSARVRLANCLNG
ncbi:MAG: NAD(P)-binding domain-containing protein [Deltaproteobacteria bacterium]|nr:NAD(P)-binding domain-containing protein [Deltaproteobacteria bacterium]